LFGDDNGAAMQRDFDQARKAFFELFKLRKEAEAASEKEQSENLANSLKHELQQDRKSLKHRKRSSLLHAILKSERLIRKLLKN
jgi:hypothetical protein